MRISDWSSDVCSSDLTKRVAKTVLVSAVPPLMLKTEANPGGLPIEVFDGIPAGTLADRSTLYRDVASGSSFGLHRHGATPSQGMSDRLWPHGILGRHQNTYDRIAAFRPPNFIEHQ